MRHKKLFTLSFFIVVSFLFFITPILAITSEKDINFSWITTTIYDEINPNDFEIDDSLSYKEYNNTDYYEHSNDFDTYNYTNDLYLENISRLIEINQKTMIFFNNSFHVFEENGSYYEYNKSWYNINNGSVDYYFQSIYSITTDNNYFYILGRSYFTGIYFYYYIIKTDINLNYIETIYSNYSKNYFRDVVYYNDNLYIHYYDVDLFNMYVEKINLNGIYIERIDVNSIPLAFSLFFYQNYFYIGKDGEVGKFDTDFNLIATYTVYLEFRDLYIYEDLVYYTNSLYEMYVLNLNFTSQNYYDIIDYYPENEGLFDTVDNVNISLQQQTNPLGYYNASFNCDDLSYFDINNGDPQIVNYYDGHKDVINITTSNDDFQIWSDSNGYNNDTIEFWIIGLTDYLYIFIYDQDNLRFSVLQYKGNSNQFLAWDGAYSHAKSINDDWIHVKVIVNYTNDTYDCYINNQLMFDDYASYQSVDAEYISHVRFLTSSSEIYLDGIGFSWLSNYSIGQNLEYGIEYNGFWNEIEFLNENFTQIISIECLNGTYYINDTTTNFNIFFNYSQYVYDTWQLGIEINQDLENGSLYLYNETNSLLFIQDFDTNCSGNIKYIKYIQHYQDSNHFIYITNFSIQSNNTKITGKNGFISYELDLIDTTILDTSVSNLLTVNFYGKYRFYLANNTYGSNDIDMYQISNWISSRNEEITLDLSTYEILIENPYLIVETLNGMYLINQLIINGSSSEWILYDDRGYTYEGTFISSNINLNESYFYILHEKLYFTITYNDTSLEYMKLSFDIVNIDNTNYQLLYSTYMNDTNINYRNRFDLKQNDASYTHITMKSYYDSDIELLEQEKITTHLEFYISDNDLQDNNTLIGYFNAFTFNYNEQISLSLFINTIFIVLIPLLIILPITFAISVALKQNEYERLNKKAFFPVFLIISIIVFMLGFFDAWILFTIVISAIAYIIKKRSES